MKQMKKLLALVIAAMLVMSMAACGGSEEDKGDKKEAKTQTNEEKDEAEAPKSDDGKPSAVGMDIDYSKPSITIAEDDFEGIDKLGSDMQNFAVEEGTVIKITGFVKKDFADPSVNVKNADGSESRGIVMIMDGMVEADYPEKDAKIEVTGVALKGEYNMEFHVLKENIKVIE